MFSPTALNIASRIAEACVIDERVEGFDLSAGLFGTELSQVIADIAKRIECLEAEYKYKSARLTAMHHPMMRYLIVNSHGRLDGAEKATRHDEMCRYYVGLHYQITPDLARRRHEEAYQKVHAATQVLTNDLTAIGFPLYERS